ncbi:MAG TPA: glycosyltransferase [Thermoleophilaceae bacterium]|nr:glycosyltransferase [Thermoleophilaceae bacterium]
MQFADLVDFYGLPARDRGQERPRLVQPSRAAAALGRARGRLRRGRRQRLAFLDATFPWQRSGFRYHEAAAIHDLLPDTLFFSMWEMTDPFPAPVHPLAELPTIAPGAGITDAYGVFQIFLEGLCGMEPTTDEEAGHPFRPFDMSAVFERSGIRLHGSVYPGGGFTPTPHGLARVRELAARLDTTFSYVREVLDTVPGVTEVDQAFTETRFYVVSSERWERPRPLTCLFAADAPPRKGLDVALEAFRDLEPEAFHLHVVGPHEQRRDELPPGLATFHGWLSPAELRELHREVHVFLSPVKAEAAGPPGSYQGVTDGFPTQAAADAMSSGCLLVSANPAADHRVLEPEVHYLERVARPAAVRATLERLAADPAWARRVASAGSERLRSRMDVRHGAAQKLAAMGFSSDIAAVR